MIENQITRANPRLNRTIDIQTDPVYISDSPPIQKYMPPKEFKLTPIEAPQM